MMLQELEAVGSGTTRAGQSYAEYCRIITDLQVCATMCLHTLPSGYIEISWVMLGEHTGDIHDTHHIS